jgi:ABC-type antimicrobial peptide transport system permease subunit
MDRAGYEISGLICWGILLFFVFSKMSLLHFNELWLMGYVIAGVLFFAGVFCFWRASKC